MKKTGYENIEINRKDGKPATCMSCGALATKKVTFRSDLCTLRVALCTECAGKEYEALYLQRTIEFPGFA